jgi:hypothetical protein
MRTLRITLITGVVLALSAPIASANLAGSKCKKVNQTKIVGDKEYKCLKQGKKKIWRELIVPTKVAYANLSKAEAEVFTLLDSQVAQIKTRISNIAAPNIEVISDLPDHPRIPLNVLAAQVATQYLNSYSKMMPIFKIYAWDDVEWFKEKIAPVCSILAQNTTKDSGAGVGCYKEFHTNLKGWNNVRAPLHGSWFESAHETFHIAQNYWSFAGDRSLFYDNTPAWYREGSASTFGGLVASFLSNGERNFGSTVAFEGSSYKYSECKAAWDVWLVSNKAEGFGVFNGCEYGLGRKMTDLLVAKHGGIPTMLNFFSELGKGSNFETAFEKAHGLTLKAFFTEAEAYLDALGWKK